MSVEKPQAELIEDFINEKFNEGNKLDSKALRSAAIKDFLSKYAERKFKKSSVETYFYRKLGNILKEKKISKTEIGMKKKPKINWTSDMEASLSAEPQNINQKGGVKSPQLAAGEGKSGETGEGKTFGDAVVFTEDDVAAAIAAFWLMIKLLYPTLELLTEEEKKSLGRLWLPAFRKYLSENWKVIVIPLLATMGIMFPKIKKAKENKKNAKLTEKEQELQKKRDEKKVKDLTCPYCNNLFDRAVIESHKEKCPAKK